MKKVLGLVFASLLVLSGCGQTNIATTESSSTASEATTSQTSEEVTETSSRQEKEPVAETTKVLKGRIDHSDVTLTLVYTDVVKHFTMEMLGEIEEDVPDEVSPEELQAMIRENMATNTDYLEVENEPGISVEYFVTNDKKMRVVMELDLEKANIDRVKHMNFFKFIAENADDFKRPNTLIAGLKMGGFKDK